MSMAIKNTFNKGVEMKYRVFAIYSDGEEFMGVWDTCGFNGGCGIESIITALGLMKWDELISDFRYEVIES